MSVTEPLPIPRCVSVHSKRIEPETIVFSEKVRTYCKYPYPMPNPTHPDGCPNYGKNPLCPPNAPYRPEIKERYDTFVIAYVRFDIEKYVELIRPRFPKWSIGQLRNSRLWQPKVKSILKDHVNTFKPDEILGAGSGFTNCQSMESAGINVFATLVKNKIPFDKKAKKIITLVALLLIDSKRPRMKVSRL